MILPLHNVYTAWIIITIVLLVPCISNAAAYGLPPAARACLAFSILA